MIKIKTLIELFDACQLENVIAAISYMPEKIIFVGYSDVMTSDKKRAVERFFKTKGLSFKTQYENVNRHDYNAIKGKLKAIVEAHPDCGMDLTGGTELLLTAAGAICQSHNIPTFQFDLSGKKLIKVSNCEKLPPINKTLFTIKEYIVLNGGAILKKPTHEHIENLSEDFLSDVDKAWRIRRKNADKWNNMIMALRKIEHMGHFENELSVTFDSSCDMDTFRDLITEIRPFINAGFIKITESVNCIKVSHKNKLIYQMLLKIGSIFEFYTYAAAKEISIRQKGYYSDIDMSVFLDWDGIVNSKNGFNPETTNEIDVMLIKDTYPIFISCKSGELKKEALYELQTVAQKFGEKYAKMIIVATHISYNDNAKDTLLQRAKDMGIEIIYNTDVMPKERFLSLLAEKSV